MKTIHLVVPLLTSLNPQSLLYNM